MQSHEQPTRLIDEVLMERLIDELWDWAAVGGTPLAARAAAALAAFVERASRRDEGAIAVAATMMEREDRRSGMSQHDGETEAQMEAMERMAEALVEISMAELEASLGGALDPDVLEAIRWVLLDELLLTPEGRLSVRRAMGDPEVSTSGEVGPAARGDDVGGLGPGGAGGAGT
ncbi:MAG: hypothetical protein R3B72_49465 [Polyangiaceae bacterium]